MYGKGLPVAAGRDGVQNGKDGIMYGDRRLTFSEEY